MRHEWARRTAQAEPSIPKNLFEYSNLNPNQKNEIQAGRQGQRHAGCQQAAWRGALITQPKWRAQTARQGAARSAATAAKRPIPFPQKALFQPALPGPVPIIRPPYLLPSFGREKGQRFLLLNKPRRCRAAWRTRQHQYAAAPPKDCPRQLPQPSPRKGERGIGWFLYLTGFSLSQE